MACSCKNKRQSFEVVPKAGTANRPTFTSANRATAESVADRYPSSVVRDKQSGDVVHFAWPKGTYEVVLQGGTGRTVLTGTVDKGDGRGVLKAAADDHTQDGAVVRSTDGTVVYPLAAALAASPAPQPAAAKR